MVTTLPYRQVLGALGRGQVRMGSSLLSVLHYFFSLTDLLSKFPTDSKGLFLGKFQFGLAGQLSNLSKTT
jgi:hypothetical protein